MLADYGKGSATPRRREIRNLAGAGCASRAHGSRIAGRRAQNRGTRIGHSSVPIVVRVVRRRAELKRSVGFYEEKASRMLTR